MDEDVVNNIIPAADEAEESVQIAEAAPEDMGGDNGSREEGGDVIELGDRVRIETANYGVLEGRVYYRHPTDLIRVMPDGVSNRVFDFPLEDGEFTEDIGVSSATILEKHRIEGFAAQQDLRPGLLMDTFDADGRLAATYTIQGVNEETDTVTVLLDGTDEQFNFDFIGIPRDAPFVALGTREPPVEDEATAAASPEEVAEAAAAAAPGPLDAEEAEEAFEDGEDEEDFVVVGKMVLPTFIEAEEIPSSEQIYPAHVQKSDALNGFLELMTDSMKKDPRMLRRARALTEMFAGLKNEFLVYDKSGRPVGANPTHMETLHDLFRAVPVPLGRPVLSVAKRFYKDPVAEDDKTVEQEAAAAAIAGAGYDELETYMRHIMRVNSTKTSTEIDEVMKNAIIRDFIQELAAEIRDNKGSTTGVGAGAGSSTRGQTGSMQYWIWLQAHMHEFLRPWYAADTDGELWDSKADSEFFREEFPDFDEPKVVSIESKIRINKTSRARNIESVGQSFVEKPFAIARALGPTFRTDEKKARRLLKAAEAAPLRGYVLFPLLFAPNMGAIRTGMLARDVEYSMRKYMTMSAILQSMGGVSDVPTSNGILALGVDGNTLGNIPVADYLNGIAFSGLGMGSFDLILRQFGLNQFEISAEMNEVLQRKLAATQNSLRVHIDSLRSALDEYVSNVPTVVNNSLFGAPALAADEEAEGAATTQPLPLEAARVEPMLERIMREASSMSPSLAANDIALTAALMARNQDLFTAIASGQPAVVAMERLRAQRAAYAKALESAKAIRELTVMKGEAPKPNTCKHVTLLRDIRRDGDDIKRMQLMTKFVATYSGARDGNWINCKACKEHLICMHDLLQLKMFHQPREKQAIQKELLLNFNGPLVGGKYQCRNCGQPIADLDFDKHLEFDDEGRPMMGAAPMDTTEADWEAQKQQALDLEIKKEAPIKYDNDSQQEIYEVAKVLADTAGVPLKKEGYDRIIAGVQGFIAKRESRETYAKHIEKLRKKNPAEAARMPSYDMRLSKFLIGAVAAYLLIEVQSAIPNYVIRFWIPGCKPGFSGYPIGNPENFTGVEYLSCAVSTIRSSPPPAAATAGSDEIPRRSHWETTGWQKIPSDKDRIQQISDLIKQILEKHAVADPGVQAALNAKRQYNQETLGAAAAAETEGDIMADTIPVGFLPTQVVMTPEEAAAAPIIAEAASPDALAALHVMAAHKYARINGNLVVGSPMAETVCCTVPVSRPQLFWEQQTELPPLPARAIRAGYRGSRLVQHFSPRRQTEISLQSPQHLYYRVFLNVCYTGPNIGHPHELGFTNKCSQCGFQFPASLFAVKDYIETTGLSGGDAKKEKARRADELREAERQATSLFAEAGVTINAETFQDVLDAAHRNNIVDPYMLPPVMSGLDRVGALAELDPLPAANWIGILEDLVQQLVRLPARAELSDKALAMGTLSNEIEAAKEAVLTHMESLRARDEAEAICETIERMDPFSFMEMLQAYVITPGQRLLTSIDAKAVVNYQLGGYAGLADSHMTLLRTKVMEPAWRVQHAMLKYFNSPKTVLAQMKLQYAVQQFMTVYAQCKLLNAGNVPGGEYVLKYIYHYFFYVILADMLDGNIIPPIATEQAISTFDVSTPILIETLLVMLRQIRREQVSMSPEQIKEAIKIRTEKENEYFVHRMETRTDDEKAVTMIMKGLKMGEWAVSAAQVQKYDADRFEVERLERMAMGVVDFAEDGVPTVSAELETLFNYGDEMVYTAAEGDGYDNAQFREDDF